jgi:23S rRNA (guanosine2251-2'-O)-methyltransferase
VRRAGEAPPRKVEKGLGGEQVEGRQAVRELLLAQRRRVHEVWISADLQGTDAVDDIEALAAANRSAGGIRRPQAARGGGPQ